MPVFYYLFVKPISFLPFWLLYGISDLAFVFVYRIAGYRKKVVTTNLINSFPDKSMKEIKEIRKNFYKHFVDFLFESFKIFSITNKEVMQRFVVRNPEILKPYVESGRSILLVGGHYNNWEMLAVGIDQYIDHQTVAIYSKLKNKFVNGKVLKSRSKFGLQMIPRHEVKDFFASTTELTATIFGADQSPSIAKKVYWTEFLNQDTPVMFGVEKFAKEKDYAVFFGAIDKVKRGHYEFTMELLFDEPTKCPHGQITETHTKRLEQQIIADPQYWLWTHKRWKRKRTPEEELEKQQALKNAIPT